MKTITRPQAAALTTAAPYPWKRFDALDGRQLLADSIRPATVAVLVRLGLAELVEVKNAEGETESSAYCLTRAGELTADVARGGDLPRLDTIAYTVEHTVTVKPGTPEWEGYSVVAVEGGFHIVPAGGGIPQTLHPFAEVTKAVDSLRRQVNGKRWGDLTWEQLGAEHNDSIAEELWLPTSAEVAFAKMVASRDVWEAESAKFADAHVGSASQNADDTSQEEGFLLMSARWYEVAVSTLHSVRDDAPRAMDPNDPEPGQAVEIKGRDDYHWVERVLYGNADNTPSEITVVDRDGKRSVITPRDLTIWEEEEGQEAPQEAAPTVDELLALLAPLTPAERREVSDRAVAEYRRGTLDAAPFLGDSVKFLTGSAKGSGYLQVGTGRVVDVVSERAGATGSVVFVSYVIQEAAEEGEEGERVTVQAGRVRPVDFTQGTTTA
jgi:hypothetical protein